MSMSAFYFEPIWIKFPISTVWSRRVWANRLTKKTTTLYIFTRTELAHSFMVSKENNSKSITRKIWKTKNPEKVREQLKKYYQKNRDYIRQKNKDWKLRNPEKRAKQRVCEKERYHDRHNPYWYDPHVSRGRCVRCLLGGYFLNPGASSNIVAAKEEVGSLVNHTFFYFKKIQENDEAGDLCKNQLVDNLSP